MENTVRIKNVPKSRRVAFTDYRPQKMPFGFDETDPRCVDFKKRLHANFGKTVRLFRTSGALISLETVQKLLLDGLWYREKRGCPTAAGGRRESPSPESGLLSNGFAWS